MSAMVMYSMKPLANAANLALLRGLLGRKLSRLPMPLPLTHYARRTCTQAGCMTDPSNGSTATAQMWALIMNNWKTERADWNAERLTLHQQFDAAREQLRQRFDADRQQFYRQATRQAIRIAEMKKDALRMLDDRVRFEEGFNVRGGLERICYQAVLENRIQLRGGGVQKQLDALATTREFSAVYAREIAARKLALQDVERCRRSIYHELSKHVHGNEGTILIRRKDFTPNEVAAVVSYYKLQDAWGDALAWLEVGAK